MAVNKTINGTTNNNQWSYKLEVNESSTNIVDNLSTVQVQVFLGRTYSTSYIGGGYSVSVNCDGQSKSEGGTIPYPTYINGGDWLLLKTFTFQVKHNADGTKTANISSSFSSGDFTPSRASASGSIILSDLHKPPVLSVSKIEEVNSSLSGVNENVFVANLSKKKFTLSYTLYDNATIKSLEIYDKNNNKLNATVDTSSVTITVDFKNQVFSFDNNKTNFIIKITDSLGGITSIVTENYSVIPYTKPNLVQTSSNVKRNGQLTGKAVMNLIGSFYYGSVGSTKNNITLKFAYWRSGTTESTNYYNIPYEPSNNSINISKWNIKKNNVEVTDLDKNYAYKFKVIATDTFGNSSVIELTCTSGEYLMAKFKDRVDFKAITIGGYKVIESGSNENGEYIKFYNGKLASVHQVTRRLSRTSSWGNMYETTQPADLGNYPVEFKETPYIFLTLYGQNALFEAVDSPNKTSAGAVYLLAPTINDSADYTIQVLAIGKWK